MKDFNKLSYEEVYFLFCILKKYNIIPHNTRKNHRNKKQNGSKSKQQNPNLCDITCKSWDQCEDENLLLYKVILEKIQIND